MAENHVFSDKYMKKKAALINAAVKEDAESAKDKKKVNAKAVFAAALAAVLALSVGATVAIVRGMSLTKEGGKTTVVAEKVDGENLDERKWGTGEGENAVKIDFAWLPDDLTKDETAAYKFNSTDGGRWMTLYGYDLRKNEMNAIITDTTGAEEFEAGGHQAFVVRTAEIYSDDYLYVMFDEDDLVICGCFGKGITDDELTKIIEGMTLSETTDVYAAVPIYPGDVEQRQETTSYARSTEYLTAGEIFRNIYDGYTVSVDSVSVAHDVKALDPDDCNMEIINEFTDGNGNFIEYERTEVVYGNGESTISHYGETEKAKKMLVTADLTYTNKGKDKSVVYAFDSHLESIGRKTYVRMAENETYVGYISDANIPVYVSGWSESGEERPYDRLVGPGETIHFTLGWLIDEDLFDNGAAITIKGGYHTTIAYYNLIYFDIK